MRYLSIVGLAFLILACGLLDSKKDKADLAVEKVTLSDSGF